MLCLRYLRLLQLAASMLFIAHHEPGSELLVAFACSDKVYGSSSLDWLRACCCILVCVGADDRAVCSQAK